MYTHLRTLRPPSGVGFKDIYFSWRHISWPPFFFCCFVCAKTFSPSVLWFFIAYTNYVWQSTGIMNSSRFACYLYKNKFIILIPFRCSFSSHKRISCHRARSHIPTQAKFHHSSTYGVSVAIQQQFLSLWRNLRCESSSSKLKQTTDHTFIPPPVLHTFLC